MSTATPGTLEAILAATGYSADAERNHTELQAVATNALLPEAVKQAAKDAMGTLPTHTRSKSEAVALLKQALANFGEDTAEASKAESQKPRERLSAADAVALDETILSLLTQSLAGLSVTELATQAERKKTQVDNRIRKLLDAQKIKQVEGTGTAGKGNPSRFVKI